MTMRGQSWLGRCSGMIPEVFYPRVFIHPIKHTQDGRGFLQEIFDDASPIWKRAYFVRSWRTGTIRGLHGHQHETKAYLVFHGAARFGWSRMVLAKNSKPEGYPLPMTTITLSSYKPEIIVIPPWWLHGWMSLTDGTMLIGFSDRTLVESENDDF